MKRLGILVVISALMVVGGCSDTDPLSNGNYNVSFEVVGSGDPAGPACLVFDLQGNSGATTEVALSVRPADGVCSAQSPNAGLSCSTAAVCGVGGMCVGSIANGVVGGSPIVVADNMDLVVQLQLSEPVCGQCLLNPAETCLADTDCPAQVCNTAGRCSLDFLPCSTSADCSTDITCNPLNPVGDFPSLVLPRGRYHLQQFRFQLDYFDLVGTNDITCANLDILGNLAVPLYFQVAEGQANHVQIVIDIPTLEGQLLDPAFTSCSSALGAIDAADFISVNVF